MERRLARASAEAGLGLSRRRGRACRRTKGGPLSFVNAPMRQDVLIMT